jgi:DNA-binding IclR family transcriptional regulator
LENLLAAAQKPMENLARKMNESCHLSVIDHDELLVLWQALTPANVRISVQVGARFSPVNTVSGRMLIATMPSDKRLEFLASSRDYQQLSENEQNEMLLKLDEIRFQGVSYSENETIFGVKDYAVLVGNPRVGLAAALAITSMTSARSAKATKEIFFAMNECAATITKNAGMANPTESI